MKSMVRLCVAALLAGSMLSSSFATAQSVVGAPPPPVDLTLAQQKITELETALRDTNRAADELTRENFRLRLENERLKQSLETAQRAAMANGGPVPSVAPSLGSVSPPPSVSIPQPPPLTPATQPAAPPPPQSASTAADAESAAYNAAVSLAPRDPAAAEAALRAFLASYPSSRRAGEATYFLGRTQYVQRKYNAAAQTFLDVVEKTPRAPRAPESMIWLGAALREEGAATGNLGKIRTGCSLFRELPERFPSASAEVRRQAQSELARPAAPGGRAICANS